MSDIDNFVASDRNDDGTVSLVGIKRGGKIVALLDEDGKNHGSLVLAEKNLLTGGSVFSAGGKDVTDVVGSVVKNTAVGIGNSIVRCQGTAKNTASFLEYCEASSAGAMRLIANFGVNGARTAGLLSDQVPLALATSAKFVLIMEAANDAMNSVSISAHRANMQAICSAIFGAGKVPVIIASPPTNGFNIHRYNASDKQLAEAAGIAFVNPWASCTKNGAWTDTSFSIDGVHPTPKASRLAGVELWRLLQTLFIGSADLAWTNDDPDGMLSNCLNLTNVSGVPTGWTGAAGVTHSCAEAGTGEVVGNWWKQTATNITGWQVSSRAGVALPANWQAGDVVRMSARLRTVGFEANGSAGNMSYASQGKIGAYIAMSWAGGSLGEMLLREVDGDVNGVFSAYGTIPVGATGGNFTSVIIQTASASGEFSIAQLQVHNLSLAARI